MTLAGGDDQRVNGSMCIHCQAAALVFDIWEGGQIAQADTFSPVHIRRQTERGGTDVSSCLVYFHFRTFLFEASVLLTALK